MAGFDIFMRLIVNSTVGIGGIADVVGGEPRSGISGKPWASGGWEGFYLVLPILALPIRDLVGKFIVDPYFDPFAHWVGNTGRDNVSYAKQGMGGIDEFAGVVDELRQIRRTSVDYYAAIRSLYRQKRKSEFQMAKGWTCRQFLILGTTWHRKISISRWLVPPTAQ